MGWLLKLFGGGVVKKLGGTLINRVFDTKQQNLKSIADYEAVAAKGMKGSWKDEYLTLVFSSPILCDIIGAFEEIFFGSDYFPRTADRIYESFAATGLDYTQIMSIIVTASFGIHVSRAVRQGGITRAIGKIHEMREGRRSERSDRVPDNWK